MVAKLADKKSISIIARKFAPENPITSEKNKSVSFDILFLSKIVIMTFIMM